MHLDLSHLPSFSHLSSVLHLTSLPLVPVLAAALLVVLGIALVRRSRGTSYRSGSGRRPAGPTRFGMAPSPRVAASRRLAAVQSGPFAAAHSITAAQPFLAAPSIVTAQPVLAAQPVLTAPSVLAVPSVAVAQPDALLEVRPDLRVETSAPSWSPGPVASVSVLATFTEEADSVRPSFAPSNSGVAFPTRARAMSLLVAHLLAALGIVVLSLGVTSIGHRFSRVGNVSVGLLAVLCVIVGIAFAVVVAARVQHDIMGGGWYDGFSPRFISYISPEVALYVIRPSGISAAARRLNYSAGRLMLVEYALLTASVLVVIDRFTSR